MISFEQEPGVDTNDSGGNGFLVARHMDSTLDDKMPLLQLLGVGLPSISPSTGANFQFLLPLQEQSKLWKTVYMEEAEATVPHLELESCVTHSWESHWTTKSDAREQQDQLPAYFEVPRLVCDLEAEACKKGTCKPLPVGVRTQAARFVKPPTGREKCKRKRTRVCKNQEMVESQRITHIAVERNRRKQMNDHLTVLRSLMPSSFTHRGDQASIIGGAVDFVKELEQLLQALEVQWRIRTTHGSMEPSAQFSSTFMLPCHHSRAASHSFSVKQLVDCTEGNEFGTEDRVPGASIEVTVIQTHANIKILSRRKPGQLLKIITALENLSLSILHLNVTSLDLSVFYSLSLKVEDGCKLRLADDIAAAVHEIFTHMNGN